jgi:hypothetical protein
MAVGIEGELGGTTGALDRPGLLDRCGAERRRRGGVQAVLDDLGQATADRVDVAAIGAFRLPGARGIGEHRAALLAGQLRLAPRLPVADRWPPGLAADRERGPQGPIVHGITVRMAQPPGIGGGAAGKRLPRSLTVAAFSQPAMPSAQTRSSGASRPSRRCWPSSATSNGPSGWPPRATKKLRPAGIGGGGGRRCPAWPRAAHRLGEVLGHRHAHAEPDAGRSPAIRGVGGCGTHRLGRLELGVLLRSPITPIDVRRSSAASTSGGRETFSTRSLVSSSP